MSFTPRSLMLALLSGEEGGDLLMKHFHNGSVSDSSPQSLTSKPTASCSPALSTERHVSWHWNDLPLSQHSNATHRDEGRMNVRCRKNKEKTTLSSLLFFLLIINRKMANLLEVLNGNRSTFSKFLAHCSTLFDRVHAVLAECLSVPLMPANRKKTITHKSKIIPARPSV